jgi:hypothetical protein
MRRQPVVDRRRLGTGRPAVRRLPPERLAVSSSTPALTG